MEKIIAFDIGNVLYYVKNENLIESLSSFLDFNSNDEKEVCDYINLFCNFTDVGLVKLDDVFLCTYTDEEDKKEHIRKAWNSVIQRCDPMMGLVQSLLDKDYNVCLISNIGPDHTKILRSDPIINRCNQYFSFEIGGRKPHAMFFDYVKRDLYCKYNYYNPFVNPGSLLKNDVIYFDDREENVNSANNFFQSYKFNLHDYDTEEDAVNSMKMILSQHGISV